MSEIVSKGNRQAELSFRMVSEQSNLSLIILSKIILIKFSALCLPRLSLQRSGCRKSAVIGCFICGCSGCFSGLQKVTKQTKKVSWLLLRLNNSRPFALFAVKSGVFFFEKLPMPKLKTPNKTFKMRAIEFESEGTHMTALAEKIYKEALDLPTDERLTLLDRLLHSSNLSAQADVDQAWLQEADRRDRQIDEGTATLIPGAEVFSKINARLAQ